MPEKIVGIHHITAIASDPQRNLDFYAGFMGLRLVKKTVNFDDPGTYHFYFGDETGSPGTILTFFPWPGAHRGRRGAGETTVLAFSVPGGSMSAWRGRAAEYGVSTQEKDGALRFEDPDGMQVELVESSSAAGKWAITGFHHAVLTVANPEPTAELLRTVFGFASTGSGTYQGRDGEPGSLVNIEKAADARRGAMGAGTIHHIAFRTPDDASQLFWRERLTALGFQVTPVMDRDYFHSIYFREPGGVLFEIATDAPGFAIDEPVAQLGTHLRIPEWLESRRAEIERVLPSVQLPSEKVLA